jgi:hypothetical protein
MATHQAGHNIEQAKSVLAELMSVNPGLIGDIVVMVQMVDGSWVIEHNACCLSQAAAGALQGLSAALMVNHHEMNKG